MHHLIERALDGAGDIVVILADPKRGDGAIICYVNQTFASLVRRTRASLRGMQYSEIASFVSDPMLRAVVLRALTSGETSQLEIPFTVDKQEKYLDVRIRFFTSDEPVAVHAIITGRDITDARRSAQKERDMGRLLASMFARINAPVLLVTEAGEITMSNPAYHKLIGYTPEELKTMRVDDLTAPAYADVARAARAKQLRDGERYEMRCETMCKNGPPKAVWLTSILLRDGDQRLRIVTLMPDPFPTDDPKVVLHPHAKKGDPGQIGTVSLAAMRSTFGPSWQRVASRVMLRADQLIRRKLARDDVVTRVDGHRFAIWFESADHGRNEATLAAIVREVRLRFLSEFGEEIAEQVSAGLMSSEMTDIVAEDEREYAPGVPPPARPAPLPPGIDALTPGGSL